jgi:hypothetical protein
MPTGHEFPFVVCVQTILSGRNKLAYRRLVEGILCANRVGIGLEFCDLPVSTFVVVQFSSCGVMAGRRLWA